MKPIAIFRHNPSEGPGYFAEFISARQFPWDLIPIGEGAPVPDNPLQWSGLAFMGGPMSVYDPLPWISPARDLIRRAVDAGVPVIGHCLGGQLLAAALGGNVVANSHKEIGWWPVEVEDSAHARHWLGDLRSFVAFQWHGDTFHLPPGANQLMSSAACSRQGFAIGPHLGMQCHVEMTEELIRDWCAGGAEEIMSAQAREWVQSAPDILAATSTHLPALRAVADRLYSRWIEGLNP